MLINVGYSVVPGRPIIGGWTYFEKSSDTREVFVSSSLGNDANNGLSEDKPKRTIAAAKALMRHGFPDWLLLRKGDTWNESIGQWKCSGRSPMEPILISSYGSSIERPKLLTGSSNGIFTSSGGNSPVSIDNIGIVGLDFFANTYVGIGEPNGISWLMEAKWLLVEDCKFKGYTVNLSIPGWTKRKRDIQFRRNVITDAFAVTGTVGHGIYIANCDNVLIEENVLDHNGWNPSVDGAVASIFRHGIYVQSGSGTCTKVTVRKNIIANSASHGLQLRPGGVVEDNLFLRNSIALLLGGGNEPNPGGVDVLCLNNVVLDGKNITSSELRGWGVQIQNVREAIIRNNIVAHRTGGDFPIPMQVDGRSGSGVNNLTLQRNIIHNWGGEFSITQADRVTNLIRTKNSFDAGTPTDYTDSTRNINTYSTSLENFLDRAKLQSRVNWDARFTASAVNTYIREGFTLKSSGNAILKPTNNVVVEDIKPISPNDI